MDKVLLNTGLAYEVCTFNAKKYGRAFYSGWYAVMEAYDRTHPDIKPCTGDILCERTGRRHKSGCIGKTVPMFEYMRGVNEA